MESKPQLQESFSSVTEEPVKFSHKKLLLFGLFVLVVVFFIGLTLVFHKPIKNSKTLTKKQLNIAPASQEYTIDQLPGWEISIFAIGGRVRDVSKKITPATNSAEFFNFDTHKWEYMPAMNQSHAAAASAVYNNNIYIFGGQSGNEWNGTKTVEEFDTKQNKWILKSSMPHDRFFAQAITLNNKIYLLGGLDLSSLKNVNTNVDIYDPILDSWTSGSDLPIGDVDYTTARCAQLKDEIYCPGLGDHAYTLVYDPKQNIWQSLPTQNRMSMLHWNWVGTDGNILYGINLTKGNTLYIYDSDVDAISTQSAGSYIDKTYQGYQLLHYGETLLLIGGQFAANPVRDVYIFTLLQPSSWQKTTPLIDARVSESAVILEIPYSNKPNKNSAQY